MFALLPCQRPPLSDGFLVFISLSAPSSSPKPSNCQISYYYVLLLDLASIAILKFLHRLTQKEDKQFGGLRSDENGNEESFIIMIAFLIPSIKLFLCCKQSLKWKISFSYKCYIIIWIEWSCFFTIILFILSSAAVSLLRDCDAEGSEVGGGRWTSYYRDKDECKKIVVGNFKAPLASE